MIFTKIPITCLILMMCWNVSGQESPTMDLPYREIPENPESYTPGKVVARMIDGLGFRFYWATDGLLETDLNYKPGGGSRTIAETMDHLYDLSSVIYNAAKKQINLPGPKEVSLTTNEKRVRTLENLKKASMLYNETTSLGEHHTIFKTDEGQVEFPFWNQINGPIEDAVWHCGQIVMLRRISGNPMDPSVDVFTGTKKGG